MNNSSRSNRGDRKDLTRDNQERKSERQQLDSAPRKRKERPKKSLRETVKENVPQAVKNVDTALDNAPKSLKDVNNILKGQRPTLGNLKNFRDNLNQTRGKVRDTMKEEGVQSALDQHAHGLGTALHLGISSVLTPATAIMVFKVADVIAKSPLGVIILYGICFLILCGFTIMVLYFLAIMLLILLFAAVLIALFVPDDNVDLSGVNMDGVDGSAITATSDGTESGGATSNKLGPGGVQTPAELRGKFLALYVDKTPACGYWLCPRPGKTGRHYGVDYNWSKNNGKTPVYPAAEGVVIFAGGFSGKTCTYDGTANTYGRYVTVLHPDIISPTTGKPFVTRYAHMQPELFVTNGQQVYLDTPMGHMGSTGCSTGPHIHFELIPHGADGAKQKNGVNPSDYLMCSETKTIAEMNISQCFDYQKKVRGVN